MMIGPNQNVTIDLTEAARGSYFLYPYIENLLLMNFSIFLKDCT